jgi:hypothetical protein
MNLYVDLDQMRRRYFHDSTLVSTDQLELLRVIEQAGRQVDEFCGRFFYRLEATRYYDGKGFTQLWLDDLISITTLKIDEDGDLTYETTLTEETDFWLWPDNETPKIRLDVNPESSNLSAWPSGRKRIEIAGSFGYTGDTEATGDTVQSDPLAAGGTTLAVTGGGNFSIGQTILIGSEQLYISDISDNNLTVLRGVNGTEDAEHVKTTAITRFIYDELVVGATLMWAGRLWKRRETADATTIINPMMGTLEVHRGMDVDVREALAPRKRAKAVV